jgi:hypothetical protein
MADPRQSAEGVIGVLKVRENWRLEIGAFFTQISQLFLSSFCSRHGGSSGYRPPEARTHVVQANIGYIFIPGVLPFWLARGRDQGRGHLRKR